MHRFRSTLILALLLVALTPVGRADAGGPTSALLTVPGEGATASLYYTDPEYDALTELLSVESGPIDRSGQEHDRGPGIRITWLIHDVTPWRVDHVYLEGEGAPWVATQTTGGDGINIWDAPVVWHHPDSGAELAAMLDDLGLADPSVNGGPFKGVSGAEPPPAVDPAQDSASGTSTESSAAASSDGAVWWGFGGLVLGALAAGMLMRLRRGGRERDLPADEGDAIGSFRPHGLGPTDTVTG